MNSHQSNRKETNRDRNKTTTTAFSKCVSILNQNENKEFERDEASRTFQFQSQSTFPTNLHQPASSSSSHQLLSNVLTNNNTLINSRNMPHEYNPPSRQYYKSPSVSHQSNNFKTSSRMQQTRGDVENSHYRNASIFTSSAGVIHVSLRHGVRIDITVDNSIRLTSCSGLIVITLSNTGTMTAVRHPNGLVQQTGSFVKIVANDQSKSNRYTRYANMNPNGITFTSSMLGEVFILDTIGTRQTKKHFAKLTEDTTSTVFLNESKHGSQYNDEALQLIRRASIKNCTGDGMDVITINDYRIWQMKDGLVTVARMSLPLKIRASPMNCSFTLTTSHIHCTASSKESAHLFVRCQDQSMHYDGQNFVVRYSGNSAGFDKNDFLIVY